MADAYKSGVSKYVYIHLTLYRYVYIHLMYMYMCRGTAMPNIYTSCVSKYVYINLTYVCVYRGTAMPNTTTWLPPTSISKHTSACTPSGA